MITPFSIGVGVHNGHIGGWVAMCARTHLLTLLIGINLFFAGSATAQIQTGPVQSQSPPAEERRLVGVGSCTAAGCHGGGRVDRVVGSEYNIWVNHDPHARAYSMLFDERSQRMVQILNASRSGALAAAHEDPRCLACHSMTDAKPLDPRRDVVSDGVGCEACHGPAVDWLAVHFEQPFTPEERERSGFWNTDNLLVRTQTCVPCHVGGPDRDVTHDLIAAGHPRLQFEMGAYFEAMPKHWSDTKDREGRNADFDAQLWAIGQACTSQAALDQLARRAEPAGSPTVWPEFAEWSCSACHHDLRLDAPRQSPRSAEGAPGRFIEWDTWNHFVTRAHAPDVSRTFRLNTDSASLIENALARLAVDMRQLNPDRRQVADLARGTATELGRWAAAVEKSRLNPQQIDPLMHSILAGELEKAVFDWDSAAQTYNAVASLYETRARSAPDNAELRAAIRKLYDDLAAKQRTPAGYIFRPDSIRRQLMEVRDQLPATEGDR